MRIAHVKIRCSWRSTRIAKASVLPCLAEATRIPLIDAAADVLSLCFLGSTARVTGGDHSRFNSWFGVELYSRSNRDSPSQDSGPPRDVGSSDGYASWFLFATSFAITDERLVVPVTCSVPGTPK